MEKNVRSAKNPSLAKEKRRLDLPGFTGGTNSSVSSKQSQTIEDKGVNTAVFAQID
tara:strand:+ start:761 stop:928 length:168 start_codon:yes stop_codon:yes gene_type:complete